MADISRVDDEPKVLLLPTWRTVRWLAREFNRLKEQVPVDFWPDET